MDKANGVAADLKEKVTKDERMRMEINKICDKTTKNTEDLIGTLSCLSCLNYLKDPMVLKCGHSICNSCFTQHSDPRSEGSLVLCEECKIETKNKELKPLPVMSLICKKVSVFKEACSKVYDIVSV